MRKLPHYFQAHTVYVLIGYPLQSLLKRSDFMGQIAKWGTQLGAFEIRYRPWSSVNGQVLVDFVVEFSPRDEGEMVYHVECHPWRVLIGRCFKCHSGWCWDCDYYPKRDRVGAFF